MDLSLESDGQVYIPMGTIEVVVDTDAINPSLSEAIEITSSYSPIAKENLTNASSTSFRFLTDSIGEIGLTAVLRKSAEIDVLGEGIAVWGPRSMSIKVNERFDIPDILPSEGIVTIGTLSPSVNPSRSWPTALYVTSERPLESTLQDGLIMSVDGQDSVLFGIEGTEKPVAISDGGVYLLEWDTGYRDNTVAADNIEVAGPLPTGVGLTVRDVRADYADGESVTGIFDGVKFAYDVIGAYDLAFMVDDNGWEPDSNHEERVTISGVPVNSEHKVQVWHLTDEGFEKIEDAVFEDGSISFIAADDGTYVLIDKVSLEREFVATDNETYRMRVTYDGSAGMPRDAYLEVTSLATEGPEYLMSVIESARSLGSAAKSIAYAQMFDIALVDPLTGIRRRPSEGVSIEVELLSANVKEGEVLGVVGLGSDSAPVTSSSEGSVVGFEAADAPSYAVVVTTVERTVTSPRYRCTGYAQGLRCV